MTAANGFNSIVRRLGLLLGVSAMGVYLWTLAEGAYPGTSATVIVENAGLFPRIAPNQPLAWGVLRLLAAMPLGSLSVRLNVFSGLCGALSVWILYEVVSRTLSLVSEHAEARGSWIRVAPKLGGIGAALFLAFCVPFWMVSNRAHTASFDILLLLASGLLLVRYAETGCDRTALVFAFLFGLGVVEFPTFVVFAPLCGLCILLLLWRNEELGWGRVTRMLLCSVAGLSLYLIAAWVFYGSEGYQWREYNSFFKILRVMWAGQYSLLAHSLPREGWLLVLLSTVLPWLTVLLVARRGLGKEEHDWGLVILHVVMSGLVIAVLLNVSPLSPWTLIGRSRLLVTPYVLAASSFGYLLAYWLLAPSGWWAASESVVKRWLGSWLGVLFVVPAVCLAAIMPFRNWAAADARGSRFVNVYAKYALENMGTREWLVTDGTIDKHLLIAAAEAGRPIKLLNLRAGRSGGYLNYAASLFETPGLKNMARIGLLPLLQEWLDRDPEIADKLAIMTAPDLWLGAGFTAVPCRLVFTGTRSAEDGSPLGLLVEHERFWAETAGLIAEAKAANGGLAGMGQGFLRHMSLVANNLGVFMEDRGRPEEALVAYTKARELYSGNVSALLNLSLLAKKGVAVPDQQRIEGELQQLAGNAGTRPHIWALSRNYGYVHSPGVFADLGLGWVLSGQPGMAISGFRKALELSQGPGKTAIKERLAGTYLLQHEDEESSALYYELLVENPENPMALLGLSRIALRKGDTQEAEELLGKAERVGTSKLAMALEWANYYAVVGKLDQARIALEEIVDLEPGQLRAWAMLSDVLFAQDDVDALRASAEKLADIPGSAAVLSGVNGRIAWKQNDLLTARRYFREAAINAPSDLQLHDQLMRLELVTGESDRALELARQILATDRGHGFANYIIGNSHIASGELDLAEDSLRRSLDRRSIPQVCNDLAWVLQLKGKFAEAEELARKAVASDDQVYAYWDTLGVILMRQTKLNEAEKAIRHALSLNQKDLGVFVHLAEAHLLKGDRQAAEDVVAMVSGKRDQLSPEATEALHDLRRELGQN